MCLCVSMVQRDASHSETLRACVTLWMERTGGRARGTGGRRVGRRGGGELGFAVGGSVRRGGRGINHGGPGDQSGYFVNSRNLVVFPPKKRRKKAAWHFRRGKRLFTPRLFPPVEFRWTNHFLCGGVIAYQSPFSPITETLTTNESIA